MKAGAKLVLPKMDPSQLRKFQGSTTSISSLASSVGGGRPRGPPPPTPVVHLQGGGQPPQISLNGRSTENVSASVDAESMLAPAPSSAAHEHQRPSFKGEFLFLFFVFIVGKIIFY